jgi:hypothetical protein
MTQLPPGSTATPDVGSAPSAYEPTQSTTTRVLVTENEVLLSTAAAISVPRATARHRRLGETLIAAIGHIHNQLPEPRPRYPRRDPNYFEAARMSRAMDRL